MKKIYVNKPAASDTIEKLEKETYDSRIISNMTKKLNWSKHQCNKLNAVRLLS